MPRVYVSTVIDAPIERVWASVRDFDGLPRWMPGIEASEIEAGLRGDVIGAVRRLTLARGGGQVREQLTAFSDADHSLAYRVVDGPLPVQDLRAGMRLLKVTDTNATFGEWWADFETAPDAARAGTELITKVFGAGWRGLKKHLAG